jgi:acyl-coenzyme A thioesterase PaaI-like protein
MTATEPAESTSQTPTNTHAPDRLARDTTSNIDARFIRLITIETGTVFATGTVLHHGRRTATAEGHVISARDGKLLAHGTSTLLVLS